MIITTALGLFKEFGYDKVTLNQICDACGITKPIFYYHLSSKEEIVSNFFNEVTASLTKLLVDVVAAKSYWEQVMALFEGLVDSTDKIGFDLLGQLMIMNLRQDLGTFDFDEQLTQAAVAIVERGQRAGQIRNQSEPLLLYRAVCHTFQGYELLWCIKKGNFDRKIFLRQALEQVFDVCPSLRKN